MDFQIITCLGILVVLVNIVTEVLKQITWNKLSTNLLAVVVSFVLTMVAFFAYISYAGIALVWYYVAGAIVLSFMIAYAAMFGFDKLKELLESIQAMRKK